MANFCEYNIIVKGKKNACYAFLGSMTAVEEITIHEESGTYDDYVIRFNGCCKGGVDAYCDIRAEEYPIVLPEDFKEAYAEAQSKYMNKSVQDRSKMFNVEVLCNSADVDDYDPEYGPNEMFDHYINGVQVFGGKRPKELRISGWIGNSFPIIKPIEGTGYLGRNERIENIKVGDRLIVKADYNSPYYSPVAIEVFNEKHETLGYLCEEGSVSLKEIAEIIHDLGARVASVTPLSQRTKRAKYALMDVELDLE